MRIGIIVDGNEFIGLGHIIRCKVIANYLQSKNVDVTFIVPASISLSIIEKYGRIEVPVNIWLNISMNREYFTSVLTKFDSILLDLVETKFIEFSFVRYMDIFIASITLFLFRQESYFGNFSFFPSLTKSFFLYNQTKVYTGPDYFIINDKFRGNEIKDFKLTSIPVILITMGGADPANISSIAIRSLKRLTFDFHTIVIAGKVNIYTQEIKEHLKDLRSHEFFDFVEDISEIYSRTDLAIINGGNTRYEMIALKIPFACISLHEIQYNINREVTEKFGGINLGIYNQIDEEVIANKIQDVIKTPNELSKIKTKMKRFRGGYGHKLIGDVLIQKGNVQ